MKDEIEELRELMKWRKPFREKAERLGDTLGRIMDRQIKPRQAVSGPVVEAWQKLLPMGLRGHSRVTDVSAGIVKVAVDNPAYMHELRMCSTELLAELRRTCRGAKVKKLKFYIG